MKVVIIISGLRGLFHASQELARRIHVMGHQVIICSPKNLSPWSRQQNEIPLVQLPSMALTDDQKSDGQKFVKVIEDLDGDLFLCDIETPVYILGCLYHRKKVLILNHFLPIPSYCDIPVPLIDKIPGTNFLGVLDSMYSWWYWRLKFVARAVLERIKMGGKDQRSKLINLGTSLGLKKNRFLESRTMLPGPFITFKDIPLLHIMAQELDFEHKLRPNEHYVGPMVFMGNSVLDDHEEQHRLKSIVEEAQLQQHKIVYCALSSLKAVDKNFLMKVIGAFAEEPDIVVIIGMGGVSSKPDLNTNPKNVHFFDWVPSTYILEKSSCAIIMAGFHTINECIFFEVPMLTFSLKTTDQEGFLARIRDKNIGLTGHLQNVTAEEINMSVKSLLNDKSIKMSIQNLKKASDDYKENNVMEGFIS